MGPDAGIGLGAADLDRVFPFHLYADAALGVRRTGPGLAGIFPGLVGESIGASLVLVSPAGAARAEDLLLNPRALVLLRARTGPLVLRGQVIPAGDGGVLFLGSPWVTDAAELAELGLTLDDFAVHEPVGDYLFLLNAKQSALAEAERLAADLSRGRAQAREDEVRRSRILDGALDAIVSIDASGRVIEYNPAAERTFGWAPGEALGKRLRELMVPPDFVSAHEAGLMRVTSGGPQHVIGKRVELTARHRDGHSFPVELSIVRTDVGGAPVFTAFMRDITDRRQADAALRAAAAAAEAASRAKSEFLATVSHEIRTPLHALLGMAELAMSAASPFEAHASLLRVQRNGEALLGLINDMLDLSKIEGGQLDLDVRPIDPLEPLEAGLDALALRAEQKGIALYGTMAGPVSRRVMGDATRLRQVVVNLVSNAVKFTETGEVRIVASVTERPRPALVYQVRDTGVGLRPEEVARVFEKFWRSADAQGQGGTGLGLTIANELVQRMGGELTVESRRGLGSTFTLCLPLVPVEPAELARDPAEILVALPQAGPRAAAASALRAQGHSVREVWDAASAVGEGGRVVLVDVTDPTAVGVASRLRDGGALLLGLAPVGRSPAVHAGVDVLLHGPIGPRRLHLAVERLLAPPEEPAEDDSTHEWSSPVCNQRVLIVDDNADNRRLADHVYRRAGYLVDLAESGAEAVERAEARHYDLILMDLEMPVMNGFEATRALRALPPEGGAPTPIVALTAHAMDGFRQRCIDAGMNDYLTKPASTGTLLEAAARWIDPRPTVLVVDDSPDSRDILSRFLQRDGRVQVRVAATGEQALDVARRCTLHLVLLDLELPGMSGVETALAIAALGAEPRVPVLAVTGHDLRQARAMAGPAGVTGVLVKPVQRRVLIEAVAQVLGLGGAT